MVAALTVPTPADIGADIGSTLASAVGGLLATAERDGALRGWSVAVWSCPASWTSAAGWASGRPTWAGGTCRSATRAARLQVCTVVGHDVRAGLLAETRLGAARGARHALFLPVGTGIAGALLLEGVLVSGDGWAGELGHMVIDPAGPPCACGAVGCLETIASAAAVERAYAAETGDRLPAERVAALAVAGDPAARPVWGRAVSALGAAVAATVTLTGVDLVLVGGGLAESGETLLAPLRADLATRLTFQRRPRIARAALGDRAGCLGAACLAWDVR